MEAQTHCEAQAAQTAETDPCHRPYRLSDAANKEVFLEQGKAAPKVTIGIR